MIKSYTDKSSMLVKNDKELDSKIGKAGLIKGQGADKVDDIEDPDEDKRYSDGDKAKDMTKESSSYEGAFERLFKATINEEEESEDMEVELEEETPVSAEDMATEVEETEEDEENLISDLQKVMGQLQGILDKLSEEDEMDSEEDEMDSEEEPYEESVDMTQKSHMKVSGKPQPSKGSVHKGDFKSSPHPKPHKNKGEYLRSKGAIKVKSSVNTGDFFK